LLQIKGGQQTPRGKKFTVEQIIGKLREAEVELPQGKIVLEAKVLIEHWRRVSNTFRPQCSPGY
jgi:hypothetical protein